MRDCIVSHCLRPSASSGYCQAHYQQAYRGRDPENLRLASDTRECVIEGCITSVYVGVICLSHRRQVERGALTPPAGLNLSANPPCDYEGCDRTSAYKRGGLCKSHISMLQQTGELNALQMKNDGPCSVDGCEVKARAKGKCGQHYGGIAKPVKPCLTGGCNRTTRSEIGHCGPHAQQIRKWGISWMPGQRDKTRDRCLLGACENPSFTEGGLCPEHRSRVNGHNITPSTFAKLFEDPACKACGETENLCIDHNHAHCAGSKGCDECVRGLLCRDCNFALGHARDDAQRLRALAAYLEASS